MRRHFRPILGLLLCGWTLFRGAAATMPGSTPCPSLAGYAARNGIVFEGVHAGSRAASPSPGDEVLYLLTLETAGRSKQWLVRLVAAVPDPQKGDRLALKDDTIFTSTGLELRYTHSPAAVTIEFIGPFDEDTSPDAKIPTKRDRVVVSAESLELGLIRYCESSLGIAGRLKAAGIAQPTYYGLGSRPDAAAIERGREAAAAFQLSPDEERLAFSVFFALRSFYEAAVKIPACRDVLEQVVQKPSLWSLAGNLGVNSNFQYGWQEVVRLPDGLMPVASPVYALPVRIAFNGRPALKASLAVTNTGSPLRHCAGIVSLVAEHPTETSRRVILYLLSARSAK